MHPTAPELELVPTGLTAVGGVPWGTHMCHIYDKTDDALDVLVPYFKAGLEAGDRCIWVVREPVTPEAARSALASVVPTLAEREQAGQITIAAERALYGSIETNLRFDVLTRWLDFEEEARTRGYAGLRTSGDASRLCRQKWSELMAYEAEVHARFRSRRVVALCSYSRQTCTAAELVEILARHGIAVVQSGQCVEIANSATQLVDALAGREDVAAREPRRDSRGGYRRDRGAAGPPPPRFGPRRARRDSTRRWFAQLQRIALSLSEVRTLGEIQRVVRQDVRQVLGDPEIVVAIPSADEGLLVPVARTSDALTTGEPLSMDDAHPVTEAFRRGPIWQVDQAELAGWRPSAARVNALAALPLRLSGQLLGAVAFAYRDHCFFDSGMRALIWDITYHVALTVERARAYEDAERERRRAERASESKDAFLAMLGHELRNPLAAIKNASEVLKISDTRPKLERAQAVIERQTAHMTELIDGLLDISRIVRGKVSLSAEPIEACEIIREALEGRAVQVEARSLHVCTELPTSGLWIRGDRVRMTQIIDNLLANAIDFTPSGGTISVSATAEAEMMRFEVSDTGAGIESDLLPHMFEPFQQANRELARRTGGLGLGLAVVKGLVELHGGTVEGRSEGRGAGATFVVRIPLCEPAPEAEAERHREPTIPRRVLIVEDHSDAAQVLCDMLHAAGHQASVARDGESAIAETRKLDPDVVVCDIDLPGALSGHDVARAIRAQARDARPFLVALSGYGQPDDVRHAKEAGFESHLTKPVDLDALSSALAAASAASAGPREQGGRS